MIHNCIICGKPFDRRIGRTLTCSEECRIIRANQMRRENDARHSGRRRSSKHPISDEAKAKGLTYAEVQKQKTIEMIFNR